MFVKTNKVSGSAIFFLRLFQHSDFRAWVQNYWRTLKHRVRERSFHGCLEQQRLNILDRFYSANFVLFLDANLCVLHHPLPTQPSRFSQEWAVINQRKQ